MAEKNENARTIQDEPTVEIRKNRKDRRVEEENRNRRTEEQKLLEGEVRK